MAAKGLDRIEIRWNEEGGGGEREGREGDRIGRMSGNIYVSWDPPLK